jgi:(p)ppGpp synthase/HD superfamily hydrolase
MPYDFDKALTVAHTGHTGQKDKAGIAYILRPVRVALRMDDDLSRVVAVLHDVIEDAPAEKQSWAVHQIDEQFGPAVLEPLYLLTKQQGEDYDAYLCRVATHPLARKVKIADLIDNLDTRRPGSYILPQRKKATYERALRELKYNAGAQISGPES